jgi:hypothetical protein
VKFSIRDLFMVTVIVAICVAWWLDRRALATHAHGVFVARFGNRPGKYIQVVRAMPY